MIVSITVAAPQEFRSIRHVIAYNNVTD
jgi:hypothetical protein